MTCIKFGNGIVCSFNSKLFVYPYKGKLYKFEFSERFGPSPINWTGVIDGDLMEETHKSEKHIFWKAFHKWFKDKEKEKYLAEWIKWHLYPSDYAIKKWKEQNAKNSKRKPVSHQDS